MAPSDCQPEDDCVCMNAADAGIVNTGLTKLEQCEARLAVMTALRNDVLTRAIPPETAWYQEPVVIVGGVAISFSVGVLLGIYVARR